MQRSLFLVFVKVLVVAALPWIADMVVTRLVREIPLLDPSFVNCHAETQRMSQMRRSPYIVLSALQVTEKGILSISLSLSKTPHVMTR